MIHSTSDVLVMIAIVSVYTLIGTVAGLIVSGLVHNTGPFIVLFGSIVGIAIGAYMAVALEDEII